MNKQQIIITPKINYTLKARIINPYYGVEKELFKYIELKMLPKNINFFKDKNKNVRYYTIEKKYNITLHQKEINLEFDNIEKIHFTNKYISKYILKNKNFIKFKNNLINDKKEKSKIIKLLLENCKIDLLGYNKHKSKVTNLEIDYNFQVINI